jgi:hypothetical protein
MIPEGEMITEEAVILFSKDIKKQLMEYVKKFYKENI